MAEQTQTISTDTSKRGSRQLNGTSFLTLEHVGYFALVVLLPVVLFCGAMIVIGLWSGSTNNILPLDPLHGGLSNISVSFFDPAVAMSATASLLVLTPALYILRRRTMAEYAKRPGYSNRVGYKLPVYTALAVLAALATGAFIQLLGIFLESLVQIGVNSVSIGGLYKDQFLPALLAFAIFSMACWYVMWFAKGKDLSKQFVTLISVLCGVLAIALFVTTLTLNHQSKNEPSQQEFPPIYNTQRY